MDSLFRFLVKYEGPIYVFLGLGAIYVFRKLWLAWVEWRRAVFGLEKELAFQRLRTATSATILLLIFALSQFCLVTFVVPFLPSVTFAFTATPNLLTTLDSNNAPSPAVTPEALGLFVPGAITSGCVPDQIVISSPLPGQEISGQIILTGTVNITDFGFYKYEYAPQGTENWSTIAAGREIITEDQLGTWDTEILTPGDYDLRLVVVDTQGNTLPACVVPVRILEVTQP